MRRTQSLELSGAYYSTSPAAWGGSLPNLRAGESKPSLFLPWKGPTYPLPNTVASRKNVTREK